MKIDIHAHVLPKRWPDLRERYGYGGFIKLLHHGDPGSCKHGDIPFGCAHMVKDETFFRAVEPELWDSGARIAECDQHGVDVQILSTVPVMFSYWAKPQDTLDLCKLLNDDIAERLIEHPRRFAGLGTLPMQAPSLAAAEVARCRAIGLCGVEIGTHVETWNLDNPRFDEVWAACAEHDMAVFVHPWDMMGMERMPRHWLPWLVGMPPETSLSICSLIMGGVMDRFPTVRFVFAHAGGSFHGTLGRIDHGHHVRPDLCQTHTTRKPSDYLRQFWVDSLVHDLDMLRLIVRRMGADRVCLGTDAPFPLGDLTPGSMIEGADFDPMTKELLLSGAALQAFGLDRRMFETQASVAHSERIGMGRHAARHFGGANRGGNEWM